MSVRTAIWRRSVTHAWVMWSQPESPLYDPEKALNLWDRRSNLIINGLVQMGMRGLLPEDVEVTL